MKKKISLKDIAKKVGVSTATVSYVLSKENENKVSVEVADKVKQAAKELNYQPNQIAKSLKSGKTNTIGLIVADISNPFFGQIARIIEDEAAKRDYTVIFGSSDEKATRSWNLIQFLTNRQVDGFIIAPTEGSEEQLLFLKEQNIPFVLIDRIFPEIPSSYIIINNFEAAYSAVHRLIETGNKKIGIIAYTTSLHHMRERIRGYRNAMEDQGIEIQEEWLGEVTFADMKIEVRSAIDGMLMGQNPINAIFFATNTLAVLGLKYLDELNYRVPQNVAVVSFDQGEAFDFYYCPLTYLKQPLKEIGENAVEILTNQISNSGKENQHVFMDAELVVRKSCDRR